MTKNLTRSAAVLAACLSLAVCASAGKRLAQSREKDPQHQYNLGLFHLNNQAVEPGRNAVDEAMTYFRRCLSLEPRFYLSWNALGLAHSMKGEIDQALQAYQKCLEINPGFSEARNNLGTLYQEMGFPDKAEAEYRKVLQDPNYASRELPLYNLARLYFTMEKTDAALENAAAAVRANPRLAMGHNLMGLILEKQGDPAAAIAAFEAADKIMPDDPVFGFNLAAAYVRAGELDKAEALFGRIGGKVQDPESRARIAEYLKQIKDKR